MNGEDLPSGIYFCRLMVTSEDGRRYEPDNKLMLLKIAGLPSLLINGDKSNN